jgi:acyl-CoA reductase-like NAD-dependent aldehyde dehydrogenase
VPITPYRANLTLRLPDELPALGHMELASKLGVEKMDRLVNDALSKGAKRLTVESVEDKRVVDGASAYLPVILDNVTPDQDIYYQGMSFVKKWSNS